MAEKFYKKFDPDYDFSEADYVIVGSGIGSLTTAVFLSKAGKKVVILERHYVPGGFSHTFKRKNGFVWDVGIHYVGRIGPDSMFERISNYLSGNRLKWESMGNVYDQVRWNGNTYNFVSGEDEFKKQMIEYFPGHESDIEAYLKLIRKVSRRSAFFFAQKALPPVLRFLTGWIMRRRFRKYSRQTTYDILKDVTDNDDLRNVLCGQCGDYGLPPKKSSFAAHAIVVNHFMEGGYYPVGGADQIYKNMVREIHENGGKVFVNAEVSEIIVEKRKVEGFVVNGKKIPFRKIVSGIGIRNTYGKLIDRQKLTASQLDFENVKPSHSHFCLYLGLNKSDEELGLPLHNVWYYLGQDMETVLDDLLLDSKKDIHFAYISFPSAKDPEWTEKHGNTSTIQAVGISNYDWFEKFEDSEWMNRSEEYEKIKTDFKDKMLAKLCELFPQIKDHIEVIEVSTPLTTKHFTNHPRGEIYGLEHSPQRFDLKCLEPRTNIKGLFLAGQDIATVGYGGAVASGLLCATQILQYRMWKEFRSMGKDAD